MPPRQIATTRCLPLANAQRTANCAPVIAGQNCWSKGAAQQISIVGIAPTHRLKEPSKVCSPSDVGSLEHRWPGLHRDPVVTDHAERWPPEDRHNGDGRRWRSAASAPPISSGRISSPRHPTASSDHGGTDRDACQSTTQHRLPTVTFAPGGSGAARAEAGGVVSEPVTEPVEWAREIVIVIPTRGTASGATEEAPEWRPRCRADRRRQQPGWRTRSPALVAAELGRIGVIHRATARQNSAPPYRHGFRCARFQASGPLSSPDGTRLLPIPSAAAS